MDQFDLNRLTPDDFERVCKDVFEKHLSVDLEIFARGRDGGVDLRFVDPKDSSTTIVQCKHWATSGRDKLVRHYKMAEAEKVKAIAPDRYLIGASVEFTPATKDALVTLLGTYLRTPGDILGSTEIIAILAKSPEIVRRHFRLWLSSSEVLHGVLHQGILNRSAALREDIDESTRLFVPNQSYYDAREIAQAENLVVIAGPPGIGKSTLAHVLAAGYVAEGFELIEATDRLADIDETWAPRKQVFFVDDFLGQTVLQPDKANAANTSLRRLVRAAKRDDQKRIILTTREYILAHAQETSEKIAYSGIDVAKHTIDVSHYTKEIRARILYNHIYFSGLSGQQKAEFSDEAAYTRVIEHPNYSPRLLEHALIEVQNSSNRYMRAADAVLRNLEHPQRLWRTIVENVLSEAEVALLISIFSLGGRSSLEHVEVAWNRFLKRESSPETSRTFRRYIKRLEGSMLRLVAQGGATRVDFLNPSVQDYLLEYSIEHPEVLRSLAGTAAYLKQLQTLWYYRRSIHGPQVLAALKNSGSELDATVHRLAVEGRTPSGLALSESARLRLLIELADFNRSDLIVAQARASLEDEESWARSLGANGLIELVNLLKSVTVSNLRSYRTRMAIVAGKMLLDEIHDWDSFIAAEEVCERLGDMTPLGTQDAISEKGIEIALEIVSEWDIIEGDDPPPYIDDDQLQSVLDYLNENGSDHVDGYEQASKYLDSVGPSGSAKSSSGRARQPVEADRDSLRNLFSYFALDERGQSL